MSVIVDGSVEAVGRLTTPNGGTGPQRCAAWAAAGIADEYVVYEDSSGTVFAGGVAARITVDPRAVTTVADGATETRAYPGTPSAALADALRRLPMPSWRVYGWVAFEFTSHLDPAHRTGTLAELVVPEFEIRIAADGTVEQRDVPEHLRDRLAGIEPLTGAAATAVDVYRRDEGFIAAVGTAISEIRAGAYDKVIMSRRLPVPFALDVPRSYALGRASNTPARSFLLNLSGFETAGFSPEIVGAVHAEGTVETQPLAGTRALHLDGADPAALREELLSDSKEIVEHAISVRLSCSEIDAVCTPGSRVVSDFMSVRERGSVQHLASMVRGRLAPGLSPWDALDVLFPAVTASGIPKAAAVAAIARLEPQPRGAYSGAVVTASSDGDLDAALVLRSMYSTGERAWLQAGAGIIAESTPEREFEETCEKLSSVAPYLVRKEIR